MRRAPSDERRRSARAGAAASLAALALALPGCGDDETSSGHATTTADAGSDAAATGCAPGQWAGGPDGACVDAGVPAACAEGFAPSADGCDPILPAEPCAAGTIAVPGDAACRDVAPCEGGPWGAAPIDATTQFVDAAYAGADSDGSEAKPWPTVQAAVDAAVTSAVVAIAPGQYDEALVVKGKSVRLWGRCPAEVAIAGGIAAIQISGSKASATELHDLALTGDGYGAVVSGAKQVLLDRVWIHDLDGRGIDVEDPLGPAEATLARSLVEGTVGDGVYVAGAALHVDASVVRDNALSGANDLGSGVAAFVSAGPSTLDVVGSLVERNAGGGIYVDGSSLVLERSVVRSSAAHAPDAIVAGLQVIFDDADGNAASAEVADSVFEANESAGLVVLGATLGVERTLVRDTLPVPADQAFGYGIHAEAFHGRASLTVRASAVLRSRGGVGIAGSDGTLEGVRIEESRATAADHLGGACIAVLRAEDEHSVAVVRGSLVRQCDTGGITVRGSATIEDSLFAAIAPEPASGLFGRGIEITYEPGLVTRGDATIRNSRVEDSHDIGILAASADVVLEDVVVLRTAPQQASGKFGDGILVIAEPVDPSDPASPPVGASAKILRARVEDCARAGVVNISSQVGLGDSTLRCNAVDLDGEEHLGLPFHFDELGANTCGCDAPSACTVQTANLEVPSL